MINNYSFISLKNRAQYLFIVIGLLFYIINGCGLPDVVPDPQEAILELSFFEEDRMVDFGEEVTLTGFATHSKGESVDILWEITSQPSGSTVSINNPTENMITFLPDVLGDYTVRFTANSDDGLSEFEEVVLTVIKAPVRLSGTLNNDLILENVYDDPSDPDYLVSGIYQVSADLTIEEGVLIIFEEDAGLSVESEGSLTAIGSESAPIVMTGVQKTKGFWKGLNFESRDLDNELKYVTVEYGGSGGFDGANRKANLTLADAIIKISNTFLTNGEGIGLLTRNQEDELLDFNNNILSGNDLPAEINKAQFHFLNASNDFSGNDEDYINSWGENALIENVTWNALNVPYRLREGREYIESDLILEEGVEIVGKDKSAIYIEQNGSLTAIGTEDEPIIFRGDEDVKGYWEGVAFFSNSTKNILEHVTVKNGGQKGFNIQLTDGAQLKLKNSRIEMSSDMGLKLVTVESKLVEFSNNVITSNRIPIECKVNHFHYFDNESDLTGNDEDVIITTWADHPTETDVTWKKTTAPFKITKADFIQSTITIEPGAEFIFTDDSGLEVWDQGAIIAEGTTEEPIIFRGDEDVQGYWRGLIVYSKSASNIMSNVVFSNGGSKPFNGAKSNVVVWREARMQIFDSMFTMSGGYGIGVGDDGILTESGNSFSNNVEGDIYFENL